MNELSRHITALLLEHNCVIVPRLGGFVAGDIPATYVQDEELLLPPRRTVGFTPRLTMNDGLLVESYMRAYSVNYPEAVKLVSRAVSDLKEEMREHGVAELGNIGRLTMRLDGHYDFVSDEAGILAPTLYGLSSVSAKRSLGTSTRESRMEDHSAARDLSTPNKKKQHHRLARLWREVTSYVSAAVVALIFYIAWAPAVSNKPTIIEGQVAALPLAGIEIPRAAMPEAKKTTSQSANEVSQSVKDVPEPIRQPEPTEKAIHKPYTLVLASRISQSGAEGLVSTLHKAGHNEAEVYQHHKLVRVIFDRYTDESSAFQALNTLRKVSPEVFRDAWVMKINLSE